MIRTEVLTRIVEQFANETSRWYDEAYPMAYSLFLMLATMQLSWSALGWILERDDPRSLIVAFVRRVLFLSLGYALLVNFRSWSFALLDGFAEAGRRLSGLPALDPSTVLDQGIAVAFMIFGHSNDTGLLSYFGSGILFAIIGLLVFLAFALIAVQMMITTIEAYFVLGAGVLFVSFIGLELTAPIASRLISAAVGVGAKLFTIYLVVGVGMQLAQGWVPLLEQSGRSLPALLEVLGAALVYVFLAWSIPNLTASAMSGAVTLTLSDAVFLASNASRASSHVQRAAATLAYPTVSVLAQVRHAAAPTLSAVSSRVAKSTQFRAAARARKSDGDAGKTKQKPESSKGSTDSSRREGDDS